ncbi:MAG: hypothetical protein KBE65_13780 [Phycisphaerae bacterium]|nr:hypothetical protein [Phycisphaerae bacterium]
MYSGDTVTSDSVPKWIADALCVELKAAGFVPDVVDRLPPTADCGVSTRLTRVRADGTNISFALPLAATVDVCLRMAIHRGGKVVREFDVNGNDTGEVDESLTIALEDCMKKAIPLIVAGLEE